METAFFTKEMAKTTYGNGFFYQRNDKDHQRNGKDHQLREQKRKKFIYYK